MEFRFADFVLDASRRELYRGAEVIAVEPQVLDLLIFLVENRERVVTKDDLIQSIWDGRIMSDSALTSRVYAARKAIGDTGQDQKLIRTIPRKGLRFIGEVEIRSGSGEQLGAAPRPRQTLAQPRAAAALPDGPAIAVLPFVNMSGDPEQEYFSDGISEDLITALSKLRWFLVIARNSSFTYKGKSAHVKEIAAELGVDYVIEGSVRKSGDRVRITVQLNDAATGSHLWAERYDRQLADVFQVQDEITEAIVAAIEPFLYAAENFHARRKPPESLDAWDLVMQALSHYWLLTREDNALAQELVGKAIAIAPHYGQALGLLAASHCFGAYMGWADMAASIPLARDAALQALQADSEDPWAHYALAGVLLLARRFEDSLAEFELTLRLNPNFALAQGIYGFALNFCGRWQDANEAANRALRLSPRDPFASLYYSIASFAQFLGKNYAESLRLARVGIRLRSDYPSAHRLLAAAAAMAGESDIAAAALEGLRRAQPEISLQWVAANMPFQHERDRDHYMDALRRAGLE